MAPFGSRFGIAYGAWHHLTGRRAVADKDGRFRIDGLLPGARYTLVASPEEVRPGKSVTHHRKGLTVEAGKEKDVGDVKPDPAL
jgi:hypothetical protein